VGAFGCILVLIDRLHIHLEHRPYHDRIQLLNFLGLLLVFSYSSRMGLSFLRKGVFVRQALLIGDTPMAHLLIDCVAAERQKGHFLGFKLAGYVADDLGEAGRHTLRYLGRLDEIPALRKQHEISLLIYALDTVGNFAANESIVHERLLGIPLISAVGLYEAITGRVPHQHIDAAWLIEECLRSNRFAQVRLKNLLDKTLGTLLLLASLPILLVSAILIALESRGPVLFTQQRIGKFGRPFTIYKLRTMTRARGADPSADAEDWHHHQEARITRLGRFFRRTHIDELPQLFNVLKGDMSLVGPRPEMEIFIKTCENAIPFYRLRLDVKPGITGWAQVAYRHTSSLAAYKVKFEYDLY
jgi:lipopolysaccharide/colanic/teichoic acid biosynthesis glycosyltransferase